MNRIFLIFFSALLAISLASAEVWFAEFPKAVYNIGDELSTKVSVSYIPAQLEAKLSCPNESRQIFIQYITNQDAIEIIQPLNKEFLGNSVGNCKIILLYGADNAESQEFLISNNINVKIESEMQVYAPGEAIFIKGRAVKENTQLINGFYEITFSNSNFSTIGNVKNGEFTANITLPEKVFAGSYIINSVVYEEENGERTNIGYSSAGIRIKQIPEKIDIAVNNQNIIPGNNLNFKIMLYDQSGANIEGEASYSFENPGGESLFKSLAKTNEENNIFIEKNLSSGYYKLKLYSSGIYEEKQFYIEENEEAEFKIINGTLIIKNIGNVEYNKAVQVDIGGNVELINDKLALGQEIKYEILAPDGEYPVTISDGKNSLVEESIGLTGNAIALKNIGGSFLGRNKILVWIFLILVLGMFVFITSKKALHKKFVLFNKPFKEMKKTPIKIGEDFSGVVIKNEPRKAEHSLVMGGEKMESALICIKIKNELKGSAKINLQKSLEKIYDSKGVIYQSGEYIIPIFSPIMTKTFKNQTLAVKKAVEIAKELQEYNKKFKDKIDFGISVHSGALISRIEKENLKFTGLGNTIPFAKKLAELSNQEVLLSKEVHEKTIPEIKAEKISKNGIEAFTITRVAQEKDEKFISEFLKRQNFS